MPPCFQKCTSLPQIPVALTWIRHSPAAGEGMGTSIVESSWAGLVVMAMLGDFRMVVVVEEDIVMVVGLSSAKGRIVVMV